MLTAKPRKSKYTVGDTVYYDNNGVLSTGIVSYVRVTVENPSGTTNGTQTNIYGLTNNMEYPEAKLFSSKRSLLSHIKNGYLTYPDQWAYIQSLWTSGEDPEVADFGGQNLTGLNIIEVPWTSALIDNTTFHNVVNLYSSFDTIAEMKAAVSSYDNLTTIWKDGYPIVDCRGITFSGVITSLDLSGRWFDGAVFTGCTMPTNADTKGEFKALVGSWDAVTTIWTDGLPIGN
jgi:hypothetical protein